MQYPNLPGLSIAMDPEELATEERMAWLRARGVRIEEPTGGDAGGEVPTGPTLGSSRYGFSHEKYPKYSKITRLD